MRRFLIILSLQACFLLVQTKAQETVKASIQKLTSTLTSSDVDSFYHLNDYNLFWLSRITALNQLMAVLQEADNYGLNEKDYQYLFIQNIRKGEPFKDLSDSIEGDILLTQAALHFFKELKAGNQSPAFNYKGLNYIPKTTDIYYLLKQYADSDNLYALAGAIQPVSKEYVALLKILTQFNKTVRDKNFKDPVITSTKINNANIPLLMRLYQLGVTDSVCYTISEKALAAKVKEALNLFDVLNDGILRKISLATLNVPISKRIIELKFAINYIRWLEQIKQSGTVAIVNIPAATLLVYDYGKVILDSKIIVGKNTTPTPTLSSTITEVILYPYWMVPNKIAVNELLPNIKRNINYLKIGNFQVLNKQGKVINPNAINWHSLSKSYFPYIIRQSTGCDNSLGIVKFNFYNPFTVYLHDTPAKSLFMLNKRYFSHGCMRVEKPVELAHLLLGSNSIAIDTLTEEGCLKHQSPVVVPVERRLPVMVIYSTVWYNQKGEIKFYDDVYGKLE